AAAKVGGIMANATYPADFIFQNLSIQTNVFQAANEHNVEKLLFLGSSCIYPKNAPQPMKEDCLLTGPLEPSNEPYAIAKIAGLKTAQYFRKQYGKHFVSVMPTNLYGQGDNYDLQNSHVLPGLIARMHQAMGRGEKSFEVWGTGEPKRELLYVDDMARACIHVIKLDGESVPDVINIGCGKDITIKELAFMVAEKMGFEGDINFNTDYPDGTMRKLLDVTKIKELGWKPEVGLEEGIDLSIKFFRESLN
ncbi:MAG: GDP-L-fucose synthase, partial [Bacteriovoracaceae bacterium]|nr:GDP-L-fucose synthase [Bacteriovoracaceae bacterium]